MTNRESADTHLTIEQARHIAAQCWCEPETSGIEMDVRLAEAFARALIAAAPAQAAEPVAWMRPGGEWYNGFISNSGRTRLIGISDVSIYSIPLYAAPQTVSEEPS
ncbi:hypothetical protein [Paraburkholderia sp. RL17-373-BIF-A]|uniref:hypothetical protein n=1 Tax=Paraburkholderia sp. RL17-373-BIF-A TaxID=3031629 RepID=UPI0038BADD58